MAYQIYRTLLPDPQGPLSAIVAQNGEAILPKLLASARAKGRFRSGIRREPKLESR